MVFYSPASAGHSLTSGSLHVSQNCCKDKPHWAGPQNPPLTLDSSLRDPGSETLGELFFLFTNEAMVLSVVRIGTPKLMCLDAWPIERGLFEIDAAL